MANDADLKIEGINGESERDRHRNCTSFAEAAAGMDAQPCRNSLLHGRGVRARCFFVI